MRKALLCEKEASTPFKYRVSLAVKESRNKFMNTVRTSFNMNAAQGKNYREIPVHKVETPFKPEAELSKRLKELKISKGFLESMKRDAVNCPMVGGELPALKCLSCPYFVRRVKGVVHCGYGLQPA